MSGSNQLAEYRARMMAERGNNQNSAQSAAASQNQTSNTQSNTNQAAGDKSNEDISAFDDGEPIPNLNTNTA